MIFNKYITFFILIVLPYQTILATNQTPLEQEAVELYNKGLKLANEEIYNESIITLNKAIEKAPNFLRAYYVKSRVLARLGKYEEAIIACDSALRYKKKLSKVLAQKALCLYILKQYNQSLETAQLAVQCGDNSAFAYEMRANAYGALGNYELALKDYDKTFELVTNPNSPNNDETYLNRFFPLYNLGRYQEALETCDKALEITTTPNKLPQIYSKKSAALNKIGRHNEALKNANKSLEISSNDPLGISEKKIAKSKLNK